MNIWALDGVGVVLPFVFVLMIINWSLEGAKWFVLTERCTGIGYFQALKGVLSGVAIGMWTPNRVGESMGKMWALPKGKKNRGIQPLFISGSCQFLITIIFGVLGALFLLIGSKAVEIPALLNGFIGAGLSLGTLFLLLMPLIFQRSRKGILNWLFRSEKIKKWANRMEGDITRKDMKRVFLLGVIRYLVFSTQFILLLWLVTGSVDILMIFSLVAVSYLFLSAIPSILLNKLGVREAVVVAVLSPFVGNSEGLVMASLTLWLVNLGIPALIGALFLFFKKIPKEGIEK